jgi:trigger factor
VKVTREKTENSQAFLTIEMEPHEMEEALASSYRRLAKRASIPGFRKGKAPREILERYLGRESLVEDAVNHVVPEAYERALKEQQIEAVARPQIELVQTDPVIFKATVPLAPEVKLGGYRGLRIKPESVKVTKEEVKAVIEQLRHQNATWEPVDRAVEFGDLVVMNIESHADGSPFINQAGAQYQVLRDSVSPAPGFANELQGMKKGEEKEFTLPMPSNHPRAELAGKEAKFKVKLIEVKQENMPELNDEFARQLGPEMKSVKELEEEVRKNLQIRAEAKAKADYEEKVVETVTEQAQVSYPPVMAEAEIHRMLDEQARRFQMQGGNLEDYLKSINKTEEQLHEELHPAAEKRVAQSLVLGKVAEEEKIEASEAEIDKEIEDMVQRAQNNKERLQKALNSPQSRDSMRQILLTRKTIERLTEISRGSKPIKKKEEEK